MWHDLRLMPSFLSCLGLVSFMTSLQLDVLRFRQATFSTFTKATYRTHRKTYVNFCCRLGLPLVAATNSTLWLYAAYLARFLLPRSAHQYLNFVGLLHRDYGLPSPLTNNWTLHSVLLGMKHIYGKEPK